MIRAMESAGQSVKQNVFVEFEPWMDTIKAEQKAELKAAKRDSEEAPDLPSREDILEALSEFDLLKDLQFSLHEASNRWMVRVIDRVSKEVIRELPPEAFLDAIGRLRDLIGVLFDERA